jgi:enoyl-CoA hydratase
MSEGHVRYEKDGVVGRITFDNPGAYNALSMTMWAELGEIAERIAKERDVRVVTLRGVGGRAFVSGTDISGFLAFETGQDGVAYERKMDTYCGLVEAIPVPTVAIVEGWAVGGGIALSLCCDFRIATNDAKFGSPIGRTIGNCLSGKSYARVVSHVGVTQAKRILLLGDILSAQELMALGHLYAVVEPGELDGAAAELCERLAANAPLTLMASKEAIRRYIYNAPPQIDDLIEKVYGSQDFKGAVRNFLNKIKPVWTGE